MSDKYDEPWFPHGESANQRKLSTLIVSLGEVVSVVVVCPAINGMGEHGCFKFQRRVIAGQRRSSKQQARRCLFDGIERYG